MTGQRGAVVDTAARRRRVVLALVRRQWPVVLGSALVGLALACLAVVLLPTAYSATAVVVVSPVPADPLTGGALTGKDVSTVTEEQIVSSSSVVQRVPALLVGVPRPADLRAGLSVASPKDSQVLQVTHTGASAAQAAALANAFADAYLTYRGDVAASRNQDVAAGLNRRILDLTNVLAQLPPEPRAAPATPSTDSVTRANLAQEISSLRRQVALLAGAAVSPGQVVDRASAGDATSASRLRVLVVTGLLLGALAGLALALLLERRGDRVHDGADLAEQTGAPTLVTLPSAPPAQELTGAGLEAYRVLAVTLAAAKLNRGAASFLVVDLSAQGAAGVGRTTAARTAAALSEGGHTVAYVSEQPHAQLSDGRLSEQEDATLGLVPVPLAPDRSTPLAKAENLHRLRRVKQSADFVVVDGVGESPSDLLALALAVDGVLFAATQTATSRRAVRSLAEQFQQLGATVLGSLLYRAPEARPSRPRTAAPDDAGGAGADAAASSSQTRST